MGSWEFQTADLSEPTLSERFEHIVSAIDHIEMCLQGLSQQQFAADRLLPIAFERLLEIISVALDHVPANIKNTDPSVDWKCLADLGESLENVSERVETNIIWNVTKQKLAPLKVFAERHIAA